MGALDKAIKIRQWYNDPVSFFEDTANQTPTDGQKEFLETLKTDEDRILICNPSGSGKTRVLSVAALWIASIKPYITGIPTKVLFLSGSLAQSKILHDYTNEYIDRNDIIADMIANRLKTETRFKSGAFIKALPCSTKSFYGQHVDAVFIDEAAMKEIPDELLDHVLSIVAPIKDSIICMSSTPYESTSRFALLWQSEGTRWKKISWKIEDCPWIKRKAITEARKSLSEDEFSIRWKGEIVQPGDTFFRHDAIRQCIVDVKPRKSSEPIIWGFDIGFVHPTVLAVAQKEGDGWNVLETQGWKKARIDSIYNQLLDFNERYPPMAVNCDSIPDYSPIVIKRNGEIDVIPIEDITTFNEVNKEVVPIDDTYVLGYGNEWRKIKYASRHPYNGKLKRMRTITSILDATPNHPVAIYRKSKYVDIENCGGMDVSCSPKILPLKTNYKGFSPYSTDFMWALGFMLADGCVTEGTVSFANSNMNLLDKTAEIMDELGLPQNVSKYSDRGCRQLRYRNKDFCSFIRKHCYSDGGLKKVPKFVFNSTDKHKQAFLDGYYAGDGSVGKYFRVSENSHTLLQGILYLKILLESSTHPSFSVREEHGGDKDALMLRWNINPNRKKQTSVDYVRDIGDYTGYVYDLEVEKDSFITGVGFTRVHNSSHPFVINKMRELGLPVYSVVFRKEKQAMFNNLSSLLEHDRIAIWEQETSLIQQLKDYEWGQRKNDDWIDALALSVKDSQPSRSDMVPYRIVSY